MYSFIFPGQGKSVIQGMGADIAENFSEAREVFQEVDDALNQNLFLLMQNDLEKLTLTENAQPALMAVGVAIMRVLKKQGFPTEKIRFFAGHSLGEYTALVNNGVVSLKNAAIMLKHRGQSMQKAAQNTQGGMVALLGGTYENTQKLCQAAEKHGICGISNDNAPDQIVMSGEKKAIDYIIKNYKNYTIKKAIPLPVSAPFHCRLMEKAALYMKEILQDIPFYSPSAFFISNFTAQIEQDPLKIKEYLIKSMVSTVRWRESIMYIDHQSSVEFVELGPGRVLSGLVKKILPHAKTTCLHTTAEIDQFLHQLS